MVFWWVLVHFGGPDVGHENPSLGSQSGPQRQIPTRSGSFTKTHHRGTQAKSNRKPDVTHASTVRFQLAIWIHGITDGPLSSAGGDFTKTVGSHLGDQRQPTSVLRPSFHYDRWIADPLFLGWLDRPPNSDGSR
jgi:hypothetical protein